MELGAQTSAFVAELEQRAGVLGVLLFGSWARGDPRPDSDVDLVVILRDGYRRCVEHRGSQVFEIIYTTEAAALTYWAAHRDDAAGLWDVAKVLYDADGTMRRLATGARDVLAEGKPPLDTERIASLRFDVEDLLRHIAHVAATDPATAQLLLANKVFQLTAAVFDIAGTWTPPPKQRLARLDALRPELAITVRRFYSDVGFANRLELARMIVDQVFT